MANHTQTGSISFEATNAVHLSAEGRYESLSDDLRDNYYTKSEFTVAPDKILSTVKEQSEQSARPNLSPFFSHPLSDIYNAETNPDGYWANNLAGGSNQLSDGWNHYEFSNTGSDTRWLTIYEHCAWRHANGDLKGDTEYTVLMEFRNVAKTGNVTASGITTHASSWSSMFRTTPAAQAVAEGATLYFTSKTVADPSSITGSGTSTRTLLTIPAGASISCDLRVSLYEGEYSGPYKPYVDQSLITRVSTAETAIEQNAEAITLRATKTEAQQMAQPNLAPITAAPLDSVYNATTNPNGYWKTTPASWFTKLEDGWVHVERDNTEGTGAANTTTWRPRPAEGIVAGGVYTILTEIRNNHSTVSTVGNYDMYLQQQANNQFWGTVEQIVPGSPDDGTSTTTTVSLGKCGESYVLRSYRLADTEHLTGDPAELFRYNFRLPKGCKFDFDIRQSIYEGIYDGPYKPYSGTQLYASQAQLKVANDQIDLRVEKSGVIAAINASTEAEGGSAIKISADKVQIDGTTTFTSGTTLADYVEGKAQDAADSVVVGGRNLLLHSNDRTKWPINNSTAYLLARVNLSENLVMGDTYTLQIWGTVGRSDKSGTAIFNVYWGGGSVPLGAMTPNSARDYWTLTFTAPSGAHSDKSNAYIYIYNTVPIGPSGTTYSSAITKAKLERGNRATDWSPAPEDQSAYVDSSIDGIQVGGRNLLRRTATPFSYAINTTNYGTHHLYSTGSTDTAYDGPTLEELGFEVGDEVTFTFDWKTSQNGSTAIRYGNFRVEFYGVTSSGTNGYITAMAGGVVTMSESNASGRFSRTATLTAATIKTQRMVLRVDNSALVFAVSNAKLEKGNKATDWTPAPEDVTSRTQRIYYRTSSSTAPTSQYMPTAWVTETGDKWAANSTTVANWTAKATKLTNGSGTKYPYLFTCEQRQMGDGTLAYTTVLLDETTTVIDGGTIITGSVHANAISATSGTFDAANIPELTANHIKANVISAVNNGTGTINADKVNVSAIKIGDLDGASTVVSNATNGKSAYDRHTAYRGTCSTAAGTAAKVVACTGFALATGATVEVYCSTANTADVPTLNVNSTGAKDVWINGAVASASNPCKWLAGDTVTFTYDGTRFRASLPVEGYVTEGTGGGLMVHRKSDATTGVQITDDVDIMRNGNVMTRVDENGMSLYDGNGTADANVVASFGEDLVELGKGSEDAVIKLCNGVATMSVENFEFIFRRVAGSLTLESVPRTDNTSHYSRIQLDSGSLSLVTYNESNDVCAAVYVTSLNGHDPRVEIRGILELDTPLADTYIDSVSASKLTGTIADTNLPTKGSAGTAGTSSSTSGATLAVPYITTDAYGRVTAKGTHTHTISSLAASAVTTGTFDAARIPNLDASKINAGTFDAARIPSLNASKVNAGTFAAARIPNLNASKINAGTLNSARLPTVPIDKGGTGQTGVEKTTDVAAAMSAASGVTISAAQVATWGKVMQVLITAKAAAAKSGTWTVGTMTAGHRPELVTFGSSNLAAIEQCRLGTDGAISVAGTLAANASVSISFTYLLA